MIILNRIKDTSEISDFWGSWALRFFERASKEGMSKFLTWDFVKTAMFHEIKKVALGKLKKSNRWNFFKLFTREDKFGSPKNNGNLLHHLYSINEFLNFSETNFSKLRVIYEFGGGYGSLCRIIFRLGFQGLYVIRDLPIVCHIQKGYFKGIKLDQEVDEISNPSYHPSCELFIALWSISECPLKIRDEVFLMTNFKKCLIAFQKEFSGINNLKYFRDLIKSKPEYSWKLYEISHLPNNYYLLGALNEKS